MTGQDPYSILQSITLLRLPVTPTELAKPYVPTVDSCLLPIATALYPSHAFLQTNYISFKSSLPSLKRKPIIDPFSRYTFDL